MARHFAPSGKRKLKLPSLRLPALPKLMTRDKRRRPARKRYERRFTVREMALLLAATLLFMLGLVIGLPRWAELAVFAVSAFASGFDLLLRQLKRILEKKWPDEDLLIMMAVIAAFCIGEEIGGAIAMILYRLAQVLEAYAEARAEAGVDLLRDGLPAKARLELGDSVQETLPETIEPGQVIRVETKETIPLDGVILSGVTQVDLSPLTGDSLPRALGVGDEVFSGAENLGAPIRVRVTRSFGESAAASILHEIEASARYETGPERWTQRLSRWYGPVLVAVAFLTALVPPLFTGEWLRWLHAGVLILLLASPSALVLSIPLACLGGEMSGARKGIISKGHDCFEVLANAETMVFGKTGTITEGRYSISEICPNGVSQENLLAMAAAAESGSHHPIALLLKRAAGWTPEIADGVIQVEEIPGRGVSAFLEGRHVYVGNAALLEEHGIPFAVPARSGAAIHVAVENRYWGHILVTDKTREGAFDALEALRSQGVRQTVLLTGDVLSASRPLASSLGFDLLRTELSQEGKLSAIDYLLSGKGRGKSVGFVGDGINDAPMLERADVGIAINALNAQKEAQSADILLLDENIAKLPAAMRISRTLQRILWENVGMLGGGKLLLLVLSLCGAVSIPVLGVCTTLLTALALVNALRAFGLE